ncbi:hypothetical protein P389DRAFT_147384 [Cystobasidium minutum MCA 4210]|uniref:uncharacterized protein n=1 Tax=Cystobasidium minutum MCA 4210 TaxID=1397322 RepID=UPI0034CF2597|eukprot:jgi/Rhomi1/147384/e_gw1.8.102.1
MVCAKCDAKEKASKRGTGLAVTDVWKPSGSGTDQRNERKIGTNKLLEAKKRYAPPAPKAGSALKGGAGIGPMRGGSSSSKDQPFGKCKVCKVTVAKEGAKMCQRCAYKEGVCSMCEAQIVDTSQYKMSSK